VTTAHEPDWRPPHPTVMAGVAAAGVGICAAWFVGFPGVSGPSWAACLTPALWGLIHGLWLSSRRVRAQGPERSPNMRIGAFLLACLGAAAIAVGEQQVSNVASSHLSLGVRAALVAFSTAMLAEGLWKFIWVQARRPEAETHL
jgi:hypothetical protein